MASKSTTPTLKVPGYTGTVPSGANVVIFEKGVDAYERLRLNGDVDLGLDDGQTVRATVTDTRSGALIDLIGQSGAQVIYGYGRPYSARGLVQALADATGENPLDVTKLYTAVTVTVSYQPSTGPVPAA
jgi:hypothetical protein